MPGGATAGDYLVAFTDRRNDAPALAPQVPVKPGRGSGSLPRAPGLATGPANWRRADAWRRNAGGAAGAALRGRRRDGSLAGAARRGVSRAPAPAVPQRLG